jgi:hypothetical protein
MFTTSTGLGTAYSDNRGLPFAVSLQDQNALFISISNVTVEDIAPPIVLCLSTDGLQQRLAVTQPPQDVNVMRRLLLLFVQHTVLLTAVQLAQSDVPRRQLKVLLFTVCQTLKAWR